MRLLYHLFSVHFGLLIPVGGFRCGLVWLASPFVGCCITLVAVCLVYFASRVFMDLLSVLLIWLASGLC